MEDTMNSPFPISA